MKKIFALLTLVSIIFACGGKSKPVSLDGKIRSYVNSIGDTVTTFKMNVFETLPIEWDHLAIVHPYTPSETIKSLGYSNIYGNLSAIVDYTYREEFAQIILSLDNKIVSVDTVMRDVIDFTKLKVSYKVNGVEVLNRGQVQNLIYTNTLTNTYVPVLR